MAVHSAYPTLTEIHSALKTAHQTQRDSTMAGEMVLENASADWLVQEMEAWKDLVLEEVMADLSVQKMEAW